MLFISIFALSLLTVSGIAAIPTIDSHADVIAEATSPAVITTDFLFTQQNTSKGLPTSDVVQFNSGVIITKQLTAADSEIQLGLNYTPKINDVIDYDVNHISGSGNHMSRLFINGLYLDEHCWLVWNGSGCGAIGYWNGDHGFSNQLGTYHMNVTYLGTAVQVVGILPDNENREVTMDINGTNSFAIESHSGNDGLFEFDYSNFKATTPAGAVVTYTPPATHDAVDGDGIASCLPASGSIFSLGDTTVTCTANDSAGNSAIPITFAVNVVDTTLPIITPLDTNQTIQVYGTYAELGATAFDNCDGDVTGNITTTITPGDGTVSYLESHVQAYTITYSATDTHGNTGTAHITVNVVDAVPPTISLYGDNPQTIEVGSISTYTEPGFNANDNYDGWFAINSSVVIVDTVNTTKVGTYTRTYDVNDSSGNAAIQRIRTVYIVDTVPPVITLVGANPQTIEVGSAYAELGAIATDNYDGNVSGGIVIDNSSVNTAVVSSYTVTYDVNDSSNNSAIEVNRTVNVVFHPVTPITGGGGGGGGAVNNGKSNQPIQSIILALIPANTPTTIPLSNNLLAVVSINITTAITTNNMKLTIENLAAKPNSVTAPSGTVFTYMNMTISNILSANIKGAKIKFKVNKVWYEQNNLSPATTKLSRYHNGVWTVLVTVQTDSDSDYYYFEAQTPSFSVFAITASLANAPSTQSTPSQTPTPASTPTSTTPITGQAIAGQNYAWIVYVLVLAIVGALAYVLRVRQRSQLRVK
jgi:PGF-pre-PGF domain-containing protein